jgi:hypothetical protein
VFGSESQRADLVVVGLESVVEGLAEAPVAAELRGG